MDKKARNRMDIIDLIAKGDGEYRRMLEQMREVERNYDSVLGTLPSEKQDMVCDFVSLCEEMSLRKLELACKFMRFPE